MVEDQKIKQHHGVKRGIVIKDDNNPGEKGGSSKKGGSGGGPKNRQILHTGGEIWGGPFLGGSSNMGS